MKTRKTINQVSIVWALCLWCALSDPDAFGATFRWSAASNRIYVENGGRATLTDIKAALTNAPLDLVDMANKTWLLSADLRIQDGCTLVLHGAAAGGDVNELRLQNVHTATNCDCVVTLTADWGSLDISHTKITSWNAVNSGPETNYLASRPYIRVRSGLSTNGVTPLESRMDITNSEIAYLGYDDSEAYGLVWKVSTNSPSKRVNVYGNIVNSRIHHNFFGVYTFGANGMLWLTNEVSDSVQYGFDPHDDSDNLLIQGNKVHHNGNHGIIASMRCDHLTIRGNLCWSNAQNGILLHRSSNNGLIEDNQCFDNGDSGIALTASSQCTVRNNRLLRNVEAGVRLDLGSADNLIVNNECASNKLHGFYFYKGSATPEPNDDGRPKRNQFVANQVHDNGAEAIQLGDSDDNIFATNTFNANGPKLRLERGVRNWLDGNSIAPGVSVRTEGDAGSNASTYVRNQSSLKVELGTNSVTIFQDAQGRIYEPDEGALLTEVSAAGSSLALTPEGIASSSTVVARNLWASVTPGSAFLSHLVWDPGARTLWTAAAGSAGQTLSFTLGDLTANAAYQVRKANVAFTNLVADASGQLHFSATATSTNPLVYSVETFDTNVATLRYSSSLNRIYVEKKGSATLSNIKNALPNAPLDLVDASNKVWLLRADLLVQDGCTLQLHGTAAKGDVNELRLLSLNTGATGSVVSLTADWGTLDLDHTKITSWDTAVNGPDTNPAAFGRAFIRVRSSLSTNGTPLESRMDIHNCELAYLGYDGSEAHGVVWKVSGASANSTNSILDRVNVFGDVLNSRFHDNYIGAYTFGAASMQWLTNEIERNAEYGLDLQSDSDNLAIQGNKFHHNGNHGLMASVRCDHLNITGNLCWSNASAGILLDQAADNSVVQNNQCLDNGDSGIAVASSSGNEIRNNVLLRNQQAGLRLSLGSADNLIQGNLSASNRLYGFYGLVGTGTPAPGDDGRPKRNQFTANLLHDNGVEPIRLADSDDNIFSTNTFSDLSGKLRFQRGLRNWLDGNVIPATLSLRTEGDTNAMATTQVRNQAYLRVELGTNGSTLFEDSSGLVYQPDEDTIPTAFTSSGTTLTLTTANMGAASSVIARSLWASATPGTAFVNRLAWTNSTRRQWSVTPGAPGQTCRFVVRDLVANSSYAVAKDRTVFTNLHADASGQLAFSDTAAVMNVVVYSLEPDSGSRVLIDRQLNRFTLHWSAGRLQHTTSLSPPNWLDLPATNGQYTIPINPGQRMEFFRTIEP